MRIPLRHIVLFLLPLYCLNASAEIFKSDPFPLDSTRSVIEATLFQTISAASDVVAVPANNFEIQIVYNTSDDNADLPGLGLRVHFNSARLSWVQNTFVDEQDLVGVSAPTVDVEDFDNSPDTDMFIQFAWASINGNWPGQLTATLAHIEFSTIDSFTGATINFSASDTASGYGFQATQVLVGLSNSNIDFDNDGLPDDCDTACQAAGIIADTDDDNDGIEDSQDAFPLDPSETLDSDSDGRGNNADTDDDNDGIEDDDDAFPLDATETLDTDGDGIGNNADADDDGDGVSDEDEIADGTDPLDSADFILLSGVVLDWKNQLPIADVIVTAVSGDNGLFSAEASGDPLGRYTFVDKYVGKNNLTFSKTTSSERLSRAISSLDALAAIKMAVGINPNRDPDGDGPDEALAVSDYQRIAADMNADGVINSQDALEIIKAAVGLADIAPRWVFVPADHTLSFEAGIDLSQFESIEVDYPATRKVNMIGILVGDVDGNWEGPAVTDADGDGFFSFEDAFPDDPSEWLDTDSDGIGNNVDTDDDGDGIADVNDGFPQISTGSLTDTDADGLPDDCDVACQATGLTADLDDDGDKVPDVDDALPLISLAGNLDTDKDGLPDECDAACLALGLIADTDDDGDGALDYEDPFPLDAEVSVGRKAPSNLGLIE